MTANLKGFLYHCIVPHPAITPGSESEIVIFKDSQPLGLIIVGGTDTFLHGIYIEKVIPDSPAAKNGRLQPGDRLMKVRMFPLHVNFLTLYTL